MISALVLWDIDHTLIETRGVGRAVYERAFPVVTGRPLEQLADTRGRTERAIMHDTLEAHGITPTDTLLARLAKTLLAGYQAASDELAEQGQVLPGAAELVQHFDRDQRVLQTVLTGNTAAVSWIKLHAFGLDPYLNLSIGAYGEEHRDRSQLVQVAQRHVANALGEPIPVDRIIIIGDTPHDLAAAHDNGAHAIGVATGHYSTDDLAAAHLTVPNLAEAAADIQKYVLDVAQN
jgi:phosphoglycolate phosphatase